MPLRTRERENGYRVDWKFDVDGLTSFRQETFHTNRFDYSTTYMLSCFACLPCGEADPISGGVPPTYTQAYSTCSTTSGPLYEVRLRLQKLDTEIENDSGSSVEEDQAEDDVNNDIDESNSYEDRPSAVWYSINGAKFTKFKCSKASNFWDSDALFIAAVPTLDPSNGEMAIQVWLQYDTGDEKPQIMKTTGEKNALKHFTDLYIKQTLCDVQFQFQTGERIGGHVAVLVGRSPVFGSMLKHDSKESQSRTVYIDDIQPTVFKKLLHYIYCGKIPVQLSEETAKLLYVAADKYGVDDLKEECNCYLSTHIRIENVLRLMAWANQYTVPLLQEATVSFAIRNFKEICASSEWGKLMKTCTDLCIEVIRGAAENISAVPRDEEDNDEEED